jgi:hypothetical protein
MTLYPLPGGHEGGMLRSTAEKPEGPGVVAQRAEEDLRRAYASLIL